LERFAQRPSPSLRPTVTTCNGLEGNFFGNESYWGDSKRGKMPFGWSCCLINWRSYVRRRSNMRWQPGRPTDWFVEWGGGYYYPDHLGAGARTGGNCLAQHAAAYLGTDEKKPTRGSSASISRSLIPRTHTRRAKFSPRQTDGLLAILVFQLLGLRSGWRQNVLGERPQRPGSPGDQPPAIPSGNMRTTARAPAPAGQGRPRISGKRSKTLSRENCRAMIG